MDTLHLALSHLQQSVSEVRRALQKFEDEQADFVSGSRPSSPSPITLTEHYMTSRQALDHIASVTRNWQDLSLTYRERIVERLQDDEQVVYVMLPSALDVAFTAMLNSNAREARCRKLGIMAAICSVHCIWYSMALRGYMIWGSKIRHVERAIHMLADMTNFKKPIQLAVHVSSSSEEEDLTPDESPSPSVHNMNFDDLV